MSNKSTDTPYHIHGHLHVSGHSRFIGDELPSGTLFAKLVPSQYAHARLVRVSFNAALAIEGVIAVIGAGDIPGENQIGQILHDEPLFPVDEVQYLGQPVAIVVATSEWIAEQGVKAVEVEYDPLEPILTIQQALSKNLLYMPPQINQRGDIAAGFAASEHIIEEAVATGSQEHFYLETQRCLAVPGEDREILLYSATQSSAEVQEIAARVLGLRSTDITVDVNRLGGAFGGKERSPVLWSCLAALACYITKQPVLLKLNRLEDMNWSGKRHPFEMHYRVGFNREGLVQAYDVELNSNGGAYVDLSMAILDRAILHAENTYYIPNIRIVGHACRTNLPPNTAFRGFGAPQSIFAIEHAITRIAETLQLDPIEVRRRNYYRENQVTPYGETVHEAVSGELTDRLQKTVRYAELRSSVNQFNAQNTNRKQGIGFVPVKFGISFTSTFLNQGSALIWIYADGTVSVSHGGIEMGQEVNTKVAQIVADTLGVKLSRIKIETSNTKRVGNASPTAASSGSDINGNAACIAATILRERLTIIAGKMLGFGTDEKHKRIEFVQDVVYDREQSNRKLTFEEVVHSAYMQRIDLGAHGFYATPDIYWDKVRREGNPLYYFVYGCGIVVVEVDFRSGNFVLNKVHLLHETGKSLNPEVDRGQVAGAFIQGLGWCTFEEFPFNPDTGQYLAVSPSTYKIPTVKDLPEEFIIELVESDRKYASVKQSKGIGEPPLIYGEAVFFAIRDAIAAYTGRTPVNLSHPATPESILRATQIEGKA